jgi:GxxExxY protein
MEERDPVTGAVIAAAIEVHRLLGPGLLESIYQRALCHELHLRGIPFQGQQPVPVAYKGVNLGDDLRLDLVVADQLIVELKAVDKLLPIHEAQLITYLKLRSGFKTVHTNPKRQRGASSLTLRVGIETASYRSPSRPADQL